VITIVWNPDHDHPGIGDHDRPESLITIVRNPHFRVKQACVTPLRACGGILAKSLGQSEEA